MLIAVCVLSPAHLEHVLGTRAFRLRFGGVLRGRFVPRTWFDRVPAGTVLAGTRLFRTRSDYKKWCVPRTCVNAQEICATGGKRNCIHFISLQSCYNLKTSKVKKGKTYGFKAKFYVAQGIHTFRPNTNT